VNRVGGNLRRVVVERRREHLEREARRDAVHAFVHAGRISVLLGAARFGVGLFQALAIVDPHLGEQRRVFMLAQARDYRETGEHLERRGGAGRIAEF
jgi:hypothetical protein